MEIRMYGEMINAFPDKYREEYDIRDSEVHFTGYTELDVSQYGVNKLKQLISIFEDMYKKTKIQRLPRTIGLLNRWIEIIQDKKYNVKMKRLSDLEPALQNYLVDFGHRIHRRISPEFDYHDCYMVTRVEFHKEYRDYHSDRWYPAYVEMRYIFEKIGQRYEFEHEFLAQDVVKKSVPEILLRAGFEKETPELRKKYLKYYHRYQDVIRQIGKQFVARGEGVDDAPNDTSRERDSFYNKKDVFKFSGEDKVVIDIFRDEDRGWEPKHVDTAEYYWARLEKRTRTRRLADDLEYGERCHSCDKTKSRCQCIEDVYDDPVDDDDFQQVAEIPIHPYCVVFDLQRHLRLTVHVDGLQEYKFDKNLHEKLVLPDNIKKLVRMLINHKEGNFIDIIKGKSGGAILLLTGKAGVGKTLTAEVFAEASEKPLYNIQASQLGTDPDSIEEKLRIYIRRASRWDAIMLIDEADVYVHERGNDLNQNAIVGVLLRVLEYHRATLFLTTNRPDLVDDAIASRCVARIDYKPPSKVDQKKIWKILSTVSKIVLDDSEIEKFVEVNSTFSGRDIKNILKLANLNSIATGQPITSEMIQYISQFNPTTVKRKIDEEKNR